MDRVVTQLHLEVVHAIIIVGGGPDVQQARFSAKSQLCEYT